jgi:hypothetical protein
MNTAAGMRRRHAEQIGHPPLDLPDRAALTVPVESGVLTRLGKQVARSRAAVQSQEPGARIAQRVVGGVARGRVAHTCDRSEGRRQSASLPTAVVDNCCRVDLRCPQDQSRPGGERFRLRALRQGKRAEDASGDLVNHPLEPRISADNNALALAA